MKFNEVKFIMAGHGSTLRKQTYAAVWGTAMFIAVNAV